MKQWLKSSRFRRAMSLAEERKDYRTICRLRRIKSGESPFDKESMHWAGIIRDEYRIVDKMIDIMRRPSPWLKLLESGKFPKNKVVVK